MGIVERKEKQKLEIRKSILDASMRLFVEQGFENVSIRKIAELIEYSPTTIYLYFKDKDEIFFHLHEAGFQLMQEFNKDLPLIENPMRRLHQMGVNYINFGMNHPEYYDLMFIGKEPMDKLSEMECADWVHGTTAIDTLKATVKECMDKGLLAAGDMELVSMSVWSMAHGLVSLAIRDRTEKFVPQKEMVRPMLMQSLDWFICSLDVTNVMGMR